MNPYLVGLLTFPAAALALWLSGKVVISAWTTWERILIRLRPWKARENGRVAALVSLSPTVWVIGLPGAAIIVAHAGAMPLKSRRLQALGWKIDALASDAIDEATP